MILEVVIFCVVIGVVITSLRVLAAYNRFEEMRRDSKRN